MSEAPVHIAQVVLFYQDDRVSFNWRMRDPLDDYDGWALYTLRFEADHYSLLGAVSSDAPEGAEVVVLVLLAEAVRRQNGLGPQIGITSRDPAQMARTIEALDSATQTRLQELDPHTTRKAFAWVAARTPADFRPWLIGEMPRLLNATIGLQASL